MNSTQALAKARKLLGAKAFVRINNRALVGDERQAAIAAHREAVAKQTAANEALSARRQALLAADAEYQRLKADLSAAEQAAVFNGISYQRVEIGTSTSLFDKIHAGGDNFAEALESLVRERQANVLASAHIAKANVA